MHSLNSSIRPSCENLCMMFIEPSGEFARRCLCQIERVHDHQQLSIYVYLESQLLQFPRIFIDIGSHIDHLIVLANLA